MTYTVTQTRELKAVFNECPFKKWDLYKLTRTGTEQIIIRVGGKFPGQTTATMHPYKRHNKKWKHWLWFKWLKLRVWIGDLYKTND